MDVAQAAGAGEDHVSGRSDHQTFVGAGGRDARSASRDAWVFKGGTSIKKCYFETYRFSEDLDFSLLPEAGYTEEEIQQTLIVLARKAAELSGVQFPEDLIEVRARQNRQGQLTFEGRVSYRGPLAYPGPPRIVFDITKHEPVAFSDL